MTRLFAKFVTVVRLERARRRLALEAMATLAGARVWLAFCPFRRVARALGKPGPAAEKRQVALAAGQARLAREVRWAIALAAGNAPFRAVCLQQAVAAKMMLRRRGVPSTLSFGVARGDRGDDPLRAHAWVDAGRVQVAGYPVDAELVVVAVFA